ncbi:MAG: putative toxin-antitoxin system toxin component, PIN family [Methylobacter sp.]|nr:MAG: putative toxin-antitoxin system toxin component, PIN family [Methylobacter sp.]
MRVVLDTNILLVSLPQKSPFRIIFDALLAGKFELIVSNDILGEYAEILSRKTTPVIAHNVVEMLITLPNVHKQDIYYKWNLINADKDDNKFVDCAVAGNADFIVTEDKHFNELKVVEFPKLTVLSINDFKLVLL